MEESKLYIGLFIKESSCIVPHLQTARLTYDGDMVYVSANIGGWFKKEQVSYEACYEFNNPPKGNPTKIGKEDIGNDIFINHKMWEVAAVTNNGQYFAIKEYWNGHYGGDKWYENKKNFNKNFFVEIRYDKPGVNTIERLVFPVSEYRKHIHLLENIEGYAGAKFLEELPQGAKVGEISFQYRKDSLLQKLRNLAACILSM